MTNSYAVTGAQVFDAETLLPAQTVVVTEGLISDLGVNLYIPDGLTVIDGRGKTLLPGLIDSHVHTFGAAQQDALRFGVTTAIDLFSPHRELAWFKLPREQLNPQNRTTRTPPALW
ncbi:MAG: imidazolonepropionase-like amidohydrolase [Lentisphaeria bacterium]|jgi:imidazolonepropionase-like amidohydrolase